MEVSEIVVLPAASATLAALRRVKAVFDAHPGDCPVFMLLTSRDHHRLLALDVRVTQSASLDAEIAVALNG